MKKIDSEYLLKLARQKSAEARSDLGRTISDFFFDTGTVLSDTERAMMYDILHGIFHEIEMSVRKSVSESISTYSDVPPELINLLANDEVEVAYPVLTQSTVLRDADLIEVIQHRTMEHRLAIAQRRHVSENISDKLVEKGESHVIEMLLKNQNAAISEGTLAYLAEQSKRINVLQVPILNRSDLSPELAKRMFLWVSVALRKHIIENFKFDQATIDELLETSAFGEIESARIESKNTKTDELAGRLHQEGIVSYDLMVATLEDGEVPLFISMLCQETRLRPTLVRRILFEPGGEGLAVACKAIGMDKKNYGKIFSISRMARPEQTQEGLQDMKEAIDFYERISIEAAKDVLHKWRHSPDYLAAIRALEMSPKSP